MIVFIYSKKELSEPLGNLEDDLDEFLDDCGETTGAGIGALGWNVDLEIDDDRFDELLPNLTSYLRRWGVPSDTYLKVLEDDAEDDSEAYAVSVFGG